MPAANFQAFFLCDINSREAQTYFLQPIQKVLCFLIKKSKMWGTFPAPKQKDVRFQLNHLHVHTFVRRDFRRLLFWKISQWYKQEQEVINFLKPQTRTTEQQNQIQKFLCTAFFKFQFTAVLQAFFKKNKPWCQEFTLSFLDLRSIQLFLIVTFIDTFHKVRCSIIFKSDFVTIEVFESMGICGRPQDMQILCIN